MFLRITYIFEPFRQELFSIRHIRG